MISSTPYFNVHGPVKPLPRPRCRWTSCSSKRFVADLEVGWSIVTRMNDVLALIYVRDDILGAQDYTAEKVLAADNEAQVLVCVQGERYRGHLDIHTGHFTLGLSTRSKVLNWYLVCRIYDIEIARGNAQSTVGTHAIEDGGAALNEPIRGSLVKSGI